MPLAAMSELILLVILHGVLLGSTDKMVAFVRGQSLGLRDFVDVGPSFLQTMRGNFIFAKRF